MPYESNKAHKDEQAHYGENGEEWQFKCIHAVED